MYYSLRVQKVVYFLSDNLDLRSSHFCVQPDSHYLAGRPSSHFCVQPDSHYCCGTYLPLIFLSVLSALSVPYSNTLVPVQLWFLYQYRYVTASNDFDNESTRFHETRCFSLIQTTRACLVDSNYAGLLAAGAGRACSAHHDHTAPYDHTYASHDAWLASSA